MNRGWPTPVRSISPALWEVCFLCTRPATPGIGDFWPLEKASYKPIGLLEKPAAKPGRFLDQSSTWERRAQPGTSRAGLGKQIVVSRC